MKKKYLLLLLLVSLLLVGCGTKKEENKDSKEKESKESSNGAIMVCESDRKYSNATDAYYKDKAVSTVIFDTEEQAKESESQYIDVYKELGGVVERNGKTIVITINRSYTKETLETIKENKEKDGVYTCEFK
jgi:uncharacterized lipoprotein NlpE involved in copper resistance